MDFVFGIGISFLSIEENRAVLYTDKENENGYAVQERGLPMDGRVLLILADGMRPDALKDCSFAKALIAKSAYTMRARTVFPSLTLPCHMSLFHSVDPQRHGISTNIYTPQVRPINGICEQLTLAKKKSAFFYDWHELRDLARPGSLDVSYYCRGYAPDYETFYSGITNAAIDCMKNKSPDFVFLYFGLPDHVGHTRESGWMGAEYLQSVHTVWRQIERVVNAVKEDYTVIITADHGGHDRIHGTDMPEDMTIPLICHGSLFAPGEIAREVTIKDIAPTVVKIIGAEPAEEWEGSSLI